MKKWKEEVIEELNYCDVTFAEVKSEDFEENTNGGNYRWYCHLWSPIVGEYYIRDYASFHGDLEPMPAPRKVSCALYMRELLSLSRSPKWEVLR